LLNIRYGPLEYIAAIRRQEDVVIPLLCHQLMKVTADSMPAGLTALLAFEAARRDQRKQSHRVMLSPLSGLAQI
jgi:hypothetical protein